MDLKHIYNKIEENNIKVFPFGIDGIKAVSIETEGKYGVFLNKEEISDLDEEFCVLAHEYGHCKSGSTHKLYSPYDLISRHEYQADRQAILEFLPVDRIKKAVDDGMVSIYEISEYLDIPEKFVAKAIKHYMQMGVI